MSSTISNCIEICNSPTNTSKSKMLYSFSKAPRFQGQNKTMCHTFYEFDRKYPKRTTNFGYGTKYDFTKEAPNSPPPNKYESFSEFSQSKKKGFGFGSGRQEMKVTGPLVETIRNKNPGPGSYKIPSSLEKISYSLGRRIITDDHWKKVIPGPGRYESPKAINESGTYFISKFKNSKVPTMSLLERKDQSTKDVPGPGTYEAYDSTSPQGTYYSSKHHNSYSRHFPKESRSTFNLKSRTPGPGFYRIPSQFGYYESSKVHTQSKENKPVQKQ